MLKRTSKILALCSALALCVGATASSAQELVYSTYSGPKHPFVVGEVTQSVEKLKNADVGAQNWRIAPGGQVLTARGTLDGLSGGIADAGFVVPVYTRSALPASSLLFDFIGKSGDVVAGTGAVLEAVMKNCPKCLAEYEDNNVMLLAAGSAAHNKIMCGFDVNSAADLKGKKIRAVGSMASLASAMGATPVNLPPPEGATAIQRGTVDCVMGPSAWLESYGLMDVTKTIVDAPFGFSKMLAFFVMNKGSYERLDDDQKKALMGQMPNLIAGFTIDAYINEDARLLAKARENGIKIHEGGDDFLSVISGYTAGEREEVVARAAKVGFDGADDLLATYEGLLPKWEAISAEVGNDTQKFAKALSENIYN